MSTEVPSKHVLIVDDDPDAQEILRTIVNGMAVIDVAADGEAAMEAMHQQRPDLVLLDLLMPRMSGFEVLRLMGSSPALCAVPVIIFSAIARDQKPTLHLPGVVEVVPKGHVSMHDLRARLESILLS